MNKRSSPGFYNTEMESKYFWLYLSSRKLIRTKSETEEYQAKLVGFELKYYKTSKMNRILNEASQNKNEIIKYLEPTWLKKKVDNNAKKLGITPYEELDKSRISITWFTNLFLSSWNTTDIRSLASKKNLVWFDLHSSPIETDLQNRHANPT